MQAITINITQGGSSVGLRLNKELVELYDLDAEKVQELIKLRMASALFNATAVSEMINSNIEEIS